LQLTAEGYTSREIGERFNISSKSVETYRSRLMEKLGLNDRPALVRYALRKGLLRSEE
jgi:DNA-binding CsgD family transcriptional regulator